ncbi:MAG: hypothetical protein EA390_03790 [Balneolaceae bacterium]|nr:MAG: hypothetical protein EA390_03790 [Balneolaceae bacterium]
MHTRDRTVDKALQEGLNKEFPKSVTDWHYLRHRTSGNTTWIELHFVFSDDISLKETHDDATVLEWRMIDSLNTDAVITVHLKPYDAHDEAHEILEGANKK